MFKKKILLLSKESLVFIKYYIFENVCPKVQPAVILWAINFASEAICVGKACFK